MTVHILYDMTDILNTVVVTPICYLLVKAFAVQACYRIHIRITDAVLPVSFLSVLIGLFNTIDTDAIEAAISAAEEMRSPIIIGTAEVLLPYGPLQLIGPAMINAAKRATVPVVVHFDHGLTKEKCIEALELGFTSIMFDGSAGCEEDNIQLTREVVRIAHEMGATVEGEIGHVGTIGEDDAEGVDMYTTPEEAVNFVNATGVDALAVAIGTAHGVYLSLIHI